MTEHTHTSEIGNRKSAHDFTLITLPDDYQRLYTLDDAGHLHCHGVKPGIAQGDHLVFSMTRDDGRYQHAITFAVYRVTRVTYDARGHFDLSAAPVTDTGTARDAIRAVKARDQAETDRLINSARLCEQIRETLRQRHGNVRGQRHPVTGDMPCPRCGAGALHYQISNYNNHAGVKCTTPGCIQFQE